MLEGYLEGYVQDEDFIVSDDPVWILGKQYSTRYDLEELRSDVLSRLWITYRKSFPPIGGTDGLTSDRGWGCMLRCGQMIVAQAIQNIKLGRSWRWTAETTSPDYLQLLSLFADHESALYSIHKISMIGETEGKTVGTWFGPNTIAQVLSKLTVYDEWSKLVVHVAMDNTVIIEDIKTACTSPPEVYSSSSSSSSSVHPVGAEGDWRPLLLVVPLRLGLSEVNPVYFKAVQTCFTLPQSLGIIGGTPNHALYFIGFVGDELVYLDPHTTQYSVDVGSKHSEEERSADTTYHCSQAHRMNISSMDPSLAMCFLCSTGDEFDLLCKAIQKYLLDGEKQPLFEIAKYRPLHWCTDTEPTGGASQPDYERNFDDSDDEFELLG